MSITTLKSLFGYKAWANRELFALLATLPDHHAAELHSCVRTLNHVYVVDRIFRAHLSGEGVPFGGTNTSETPELERLRCNVEETDSWYQRYVDGISEKELTELLDFAFTDGDSGCMSREEILLHVVTHGGYHRGNVGQVLKTISIMPPRDIYTRFLHLSEPLRRSAMTCDPA